MNMLDMIKEAGIKAVEAGNPVHVLYATVSGIHPLQVNVDQRFTLTEDFLIVPERMTEYKAVLRDEEIIIRQGLQVGDTVLLLRMQGGQQYVVLDRVIP